MRILAVVRQVPDSRATLTVLADGSGIDTAGVKFVCDPFDEFAVEQAVQLSEQRSDVDEVVAITIGPAGALQTLRTALAIGAQRGIHVEVEPSFMHDELYLARVLAAAIAREEQAFDLILCGKQGIDNDAGDLGPALAEYLGWPHIGAVVELSIDESGSRAEARREIEGGVEVVETGLPALLTCEKGLVEPRYPALPSIMKAKKKPVETVKADELAGIADAPSAATLVGLSPPPAREACKIIEGKPEEMAAELVRVLREEAKVL
jgi:electron transfer flavoprotein beta subunit